MNILVVGDSTASGVPGTPYNTVPWSNSITGHTVTNIAVGGSGWQFLNSHLGFLNESMNWRATHTAAAAAVELVVFCGGTNDVGNGVGASGTGMTGSQLIEVLAPLYQAAWDYWTGLGKQVYFTTIFPVGNPAITVPQQALLGPTPAALLNASKAAILTINTWIKATYGTHVIDMFEAIDDNSDWLASTYDSNDHVHPNNTANPVLAAAFNAVVFPTPVNGSIGWGTIGGGTIGNPGTVITWSAVARYRASYGGFGPAYFTGFKVTVDDIPDDATNVRLDYSFSNGVQGTIFDPVVGDNMIRDTFPMTAGIVNGTVTISGTIETA